MPKKLLQIVIISIIFLIGLNFIYQKFSKKTDNMDQIINVLSPKTATPTSTPSPFSDLTLPALRSREYQSQLFELYPHQNTTNYDSYLTSYDSDGYKINGLLTIPNGNQPENGWPAIVFVHGYIPPSQYRTTEKYQDYVDYLANQGFVVFKIDLRGHGQSQGEPGGAYYSSDYVVDTLNAYSALQTTKFINPNKIGLWGHSMAGNITFRSFVAKQDIPALVIWAGAGYSYEDLQKYGLQDSSYQRPEVTSNHQRGREQLRSLYGSFDKNNAFWQQVVPTNYLQGITGAIQLHHAQNDAVVNIGHSRDLIKILENTAISHQLFEYPSGGHNISGASFSKAMERTADFFKKNMN